MRVCHCELSVFAVVEGYGLCDPIQISMELHLSIQVSLLPTAGFWLADLLISWSPGQQRLFSRIMDFVFPMHSWSVLITRRKKKGPQAVQPKMVLPVNSEVQSAMTYLLLMQCD